MEYCLEDSHDMVDDEKCGNLNVLDVVEEELELSLDEGYGIFK